MWTLARRLTLFWFWNQPKITKRPSKTWAAVMFKSQCSLSHQAADINIQWTERPIDKNVTTEDKVALAISTAHRNSGTTSLASAYEDVALNSTSDHMLLKPSLVFTESLATHLLIGYEFKEVAAPGPPTPKTWVQVGKLGTAEQGVPSKSQNWLIDQ
ncbi:hypothetical protein GE061_004604 [Apolygus lucorum]|uniref:Uncharacterized protein n=1 Tax=Apolygus lucorum TaxID=248454 RepID=A0A8S9X2A5_APOLU|nr:hypothetical protein GE061_004604 [Apolygus lucorum]